MAKSDFYIDKISKKQSEDILLEYHYLKDFSKTFKSGWNYGLFKKNDFCPLNIGGPLGFVSLQDYQFLKLLKVLLD